MDERKIDAPPKTLAPAGHSNSHQDSRTVTLHGSELRIDPPHVPLHLGETGALAAAPSPIPAVVASGVANRSAAPIAPRANSQLLLEAGRILEQLQVQDADLAQRQTLLEERLAEFDAQQRSFHSRRIADEYAL